MSKEYSHCHSRTWERRVDLQLYAKQRVSLDFGRVLRYQWDLAIQESILAGEEMAGNPEASKSTRIRQDATLFGALLVLSLGFFALVRNNGFWHAGDYEYLIQALRAEHSWREIFSTGRNQIFQPLVNAVFYLEFRLFDTRAEYYYLFNVFVHAANAFLVYKLVWELLKDRTIATLSAMLFVFAVGNYGKAVMVVSGINDLLITMLTLLTMLYYVRNELSDRGKLGTTNFLLCLLFFALSLLSKATSFSILGCMLAFNLFFRQQTKRRVFDLNFLTITGVAIAVLIVKLAALRHIPGSQDLAIFSWSFPRNFGSYLVRMVFPIQYSAMVGDSGTAVQFIYRLVTEIRILIFFCIVSYSVFGFVFGNRVIRFFITWTYITVAPFCIFKFPGDWLNIRYLYLVSVGFSMILASGTVLAARLLSERRTRRFIPFIVPVAFVLISRFVVVNLDRNYERKATEPQLNSVIEEFEHTYVEIRGTRPARR